MRFLARRYDDVKKLVDLLLCENDPTSEEAQLWDALGLAAIMIRIQTHVRPGIKILTRGERYRRDGSFSWLRFQ